MYGFVHCCLEDLVIKLFGENQWKEILEHSGLIPDEGGSFLIHRIYTDEETLRLVQSSCIVLGLDINACLEAFGVHFLHYCQHSGYDRLLRVLGGRLEDFLTNLDSLHDHLGSIYPGMNAPSFRCTHSKDGQLQLHYYSDRQGLQSIVKGLVKNVSNEFFDMKVKIEEDESVVHDHEHIVLKISVDTGLDNKSKTDAESKLLWESHESCDPKDLLLNVTTFCQAFPFHLMFDENFQITQVGDSLKRLLRHVWISSDKKIILGDLFTIHRPKIEGSFLSIVNHQNATFVLQTLPTILNPSADHLVLKLKGQMLPVPESNSMLFICSPRVADLDDMQQQGLFLSDFRIHDFTRDLILLKNAHRGERELMQKLEETTYQQKIADAQLKIDKKRTDDLLIEILPQKVAARLRLNLPVPAERFEMVTLLFSDIVGFTAMCSDERVSPLDIIQVLNKMYTLFDVLSRANSVYKVETIGDAYMVAGGIPEFVETHADQIVSMGVGMVNVISHVLSPIDKQPLKMRVGIHSGPVLAGVVGQQMPRYCLFGNTVTTANKMESNSAPGRVNISQESISHLTKKDYIFEEHPVENFPVRCFFVDHKIPVDYTDYLEEANVTDILEENIEDKNAEATNQLTMDLHPDLPGSNANFIEQVRASNFGPTSPEERNAIANIPVIHPELFPETFTRCPAHNSGTSVWRSKMESALVRLATTAEAQARDRDTKLFRGFLPLLGLALCGSSKQHSHRSLAAQSVKAELQKRDVEKKCRREMQDEKEENVDQKESVKNSKSVPLVTTKSLLCRSSSFQQKTSSSSVDLEEAKQKKTEN